ncbi:hypothetical protein [Nocardioides sp. SYSU D00038]|nr:hypothetical protein [Nocardioides sp. SYSU D00038]
MGELRVCAICGAAYADGRLHQEFHDELDELLLHLERYRRRETDGRDGRG